LNPLVNQFNDGYTELQGKKRGRQSSQVIAANPLPMIRGFTEK
jgi:hypothetical protein